MEMHETDRRRRRVLQTPIGRRPSIGRPTNALSMRLLGISRQVASLAGRRATRSECLTGQKQAVDKDFNHRDWILESMSNDAATRSSVFRLLVRRSRRLRENLERKIPMHELEAERKEIRCTSFTRQTGFDASAGNLHGNGESFTQRLCGSSRVRALCRTCVDVSSVGKPVVKVSFRGTLKILTLDENARNI